jgi:hypothetical protein
VQSVGFGRFCWLAALNDPSMGFLDWLNTRSQIVATTIDDTPGSGRDRC